MVKELKRRTTKTLELQSLNPAHADRTLDADRRRVDRADRVGEPVGYCRSRTSEATIRA